MAQALFGAPAKAYSTVLDPATLTGKLLWIRGKDLGTVGAAMTTWTDQSGVGSTVTATTGTVCDSADVTPVGTLASSEFAAGNNAAKAFNGLSTDAWITASTTTGWIRATLSTAMVATSYTVSAFLGQTGRMASAWQFQGSNDGSAWTTLDTQTGQTTWTVLTKAYDFSNSTAYLYYRLNVTANNGDATFLEIAELTVGIKTLTKGARFINGRLDGGVNTGGAARELWMLLDSRWQGNGAPVMGNGGAATYIPFTDGKIYDDSFISARQSFTPTMTVIQTRRLIRITMTGGVWTYYVDNVQQATVSAQTFALGSTRRLIANWYGTVHEAILLDAVDNGTRKTALLGYFNAEHGLSIT